MLTVHSQETKSETIVTFSKNPDNNKKKPESKSLFNQDAFLLTL